MNTTDKVFAEDVTKKILESEMKLALEDRRKKLSAFIEVFLDLNPNQQTAIINLVKSFKEAAHL